MKKGLREILHPAFLPSLLPSVCPFKRLLFLSPLPLLSLMKSIMLTLSHKEDLAHGNRAVWVVIRR